MSLDLLKSEITENRKKISTDGYKMSIGELNSMYKDQELIINPDYQRYFRWTNIQKSRLIESILLGIPIPPIFVSQRDDGKWEVIDGLQRLSTMLQFMGSLLDAERLKYPRLVLEKTKLLPSLENVVWEKEAGEDDYLEVPGDTKLFFKRASVTVEIIKKESDPNSKYELFQRLNTLGSSLSDQEVRNCLLIMVKRPMFEWLVDLSGQKTFVDSLDLSERNLEQRYEMELALRIYALKDQTFDDSWNRKEVEEVITDAIVAIAEDTSFDFEEAKRKFVTTFQYMNSQVGEQAFKRYSSTKGRFEGQFLVSAFECVAIGVYENIDAIVADQNYKLEERITSLWATQEFTNAMAHGIRAVVRSRALVPLGKTFFRP